MEKETYPQILMKDVSWLFSDGKSHSMEDFFERVLIYQENISSNIWDPYEMALYTQRVCIMFSYWDAVNEKEQSLYFILKAQNERYFSNGELLFKIHNYVEKHLAENGDEHLFFGGLKRKQTNEVGIKQLLYKLILEC